MAAVLITLCAYLHVSLSSAQNSSSVPLTSDYQIRISQDGVNGLLKGYSGEIKQSLLETTLPAISSEGIDTQPSYFDHFHHNDVSIEFNPENQSIVLTLGNISGSIHSFDFVAKQHGLFTEVKCKGSTQPSFKDWRFEFLTKLSIVDQCELQFQIDEDSVRIDKGTQDFAYSFEDPLCESMVDVFDLLFNVKEEVVNDFVQQIPTLMIDVIKYELDRLLPDAHFFNTQSLGVTQTANQSLIGLCYNLAIIDEDNNLFIGIDFIYNEVKTPTSNSNATAKPSVLSSEYAVNGDISVESWILLGIMVAGLLIGNCCTVCFLKCSGRLKGDLLCCKQERIQEEIHVDNGVLMDDTSTKKNHGNHALSVEMAAGHKQTNHAQAVASTSNLQDMETYRDSGDDEDDPEVPISPQDSDLTNTNVAV